MTGRCLPGKPPDRVVWLESDVPPLKTREAVSPFGKAKMRLSVQQTQKSFSMIVLAIPQGTAALSPKSAAVPVKSRRRATLSTKVVQSVTSNRQKGRAHPGRRLSCALAEDLLVAVRQGLGATCATSAAREPPHGAAPEQRYQLGCPAQSMLGMAEVNHAFPEHHAPGGAIR